MYTYKRTLNSSSGDLKGYLIIKLKNKIILKSYIVWKPIALTTFEKRWFLSFLNSVLY